MFVILLLFLLVPPQPPPPVGGKAIFPLRLVNPRNGVYGPPLYDAWEAGEVTGIEEERYLPRLRRAFFWCREIGRRRVQTSRK